MVYSTDNGVNAKSSFAEANKNYHNTRVNDWKFFAANDTISTWYFEEKFKGLHLPKEVVDKIYRKNAEKWFPGI